MPQNHKPPKYTTVKIPRDLYRVIRVHAAERDERLQVTLQRALEKGLGRLLATHKGNSCIQPTTSARA